MVLLTAALSVAGSELSRIVTEAHDGGTLTLVNWQNTYRIRLVDIDALHHGIGAENTKAFISRLRCHSGIRITLILPWRFEYRVAFAMQTGER